MACLDVLDDPKPPGAQMPHGQQGAQRIGLFAIVFLQHQRRIGVPAVLEEMVPGLKYDLLGCPCGTKANFRYPRPFPDTIWLVLLPRSCTRKERRHVLGSSGIPFVPPMSACQFSCVALQSRVISYLKLSQMGSFGRPNLVYSPSSLRSSGQAPGQPSSNVPIASSDSSGSFWLSLSFFLAVFLDMSAFILHKNPNACTHVCNTA